MTRVPPGVGDNDTTAFTSSQGNYSAARCDALDSRAKMVHVANSTATGTSFGSRVRRTSRA